MASTGVTSNGRTRATVAVCAAEKGLRDRLTAAIAGAGQEVIANAESGPSLLKVCQGQDTSCLVVAVSKADQATARSAEELRLCLEADSAVLVCEHVGSRQLRRALATGVSGVVLLDQAESVLGPVVAVVAAGQVSVPSEVRTAIPDLTLTTREKQILSLVVVGLPNGEIARKLYLAESTVKSHLSSAFAKLNVSSRNEAARVILDPEEGRGLGMLDISAHRIPSPP